MKKIRFIDESRIDKLLRAGVLVFIIIISIFNLNSLASQTSKADYRTDTNISPNVAVSPGLHLEESGLYYEKEGINEVTSINIGETYYLVIKNTSDLVAARYSIDFGNTALSDLLMFMELNIEDESLSSSNVEHHLSNMIYPQVDEKKILLKSLRLPQLSTDVYKVTFNWNEYYTEYFDDPDFEYIFVPQIMDFEFYIDSHDVE